MHSLLACASAGAFGGPTIAWGLVDELVALERLDHETAAFGLAVGRPSAPSMRWLENPAHYG